MLTIHLTRRFDSTISLRLACPDSDVFQESITTLKFEIPVRLRSYNPLEKCWIILFDAATQLENYLRNMIERFGAEVVIEDPEEAGAAQEREEWQNHRASDQNNRSSEEEQNPFGNLGKMTLRRACATLFVTPAAPLEVVQGAYRALAKLHHPDRGGDERAMRMINEAYEVVTSDIKRRAAAAA